MKTEIIRVRPDFANDIEVTAAIKKGADIIKRGGLVAFPTETVYGLGANLLDAEAVGGIYTAKGRPKDNPLIAHLYDKTQLETVAKNIPAAAYKLIEAFWPGPLTIIFEKTEAVPLQATGGRNTIAVRLPKNVIARELVRLAGVPIAAPSANLSGKPSPTEASHVIQDFDGKIDMLIDGGSVQYGLESTIVDVSGRNDGLIEILRPGGVTYEMLRLVAGEAVRQTDINTEGTDSKPRAPGMMYRHYAPEAMAYLVEAESLLPADIAKKISGLADAAYDSAEKKARFIGIMATEQTKDLYDRDKYIVLVAGDRNKPETVAASLFGTLRNFDKQGAGLIFCEAYSHTGIGAAIMNRLNKACGGNILR